jgi:hypothetical protein
MTSQTKKFIGMPDIVGLRLQCIHEECQATLLLPLSKPIDVKRLLVCPNCQRPWLRKDASTLELLVTEVIAKLRTLEDQLRNPWGFELTLEIKDEKPTT